MLGKGGRVGGVGDGGVVGGVGEGGDEGDNEADGTHPLLTSPLPLPTLPLPKSPLPQSEFPITSESADSCRMASSSKVGSCCQGLRRALGRTSGCAAFSPAEDGMASAITRRAGGSGVKDARTFSVHSAASTMVEQHAQQRRNQPAKRTDVCAFCPQW